MSTIDETASGAHPVTVFAEPLHVRLDDLAATPMLSMTADEKREGLATITRAEAKLAALKLRLLAEAEAEVPASRPGPRPPPPG